MLPENKVFWKILVFFRISQGCFTVQLSRFFVVLFLNSNFYIISLFQKFVNNFFNFFQSFDWIFVFLTVSVRQLHYISTRASICQHFFSTFLIFFFYRHTHKATFHPFVNRPCKRHKFVFNAPLSQRGQLKSRKTPSPIAIFISQEALSDLLPVW